LIISRAAEGASSYAIAVDIAADIGNPFNASFFLG
jgi:hypothetical protein